MIGELLDSTSLTPPKRALSNQRIPMNGRPTTHLHTRPQKSSPGSPQSSSRSRTDSRGRIPDDGTWLSVHRAALVGFEEVIWATVRVRG